MKRSVFFRRMELFRKLHEVLDWLAGVVPCGVTYTWHDNNADWFKKVFKQYPNYHLDL